MDRKTLAIVVLTVTAVLLAGVAVQGLLPTQPAYAQAGRLSDYAMVPVQVTGDTEDLCVIDTVTQRMLFFTYPVNGKQLELVGNRGVDLKKDFHREGQ